MNGRFLALRWNGAVARFVLTVAVASLLLFLLAGLSGCGKKQQQSDVGLTPVEEPVETVKVPGDDLPMVDEGEPEATEMDVPTLALKPVFYDFDKFDLKSDARETLNANGRLLKDHPQVMITIEGHCDERGTVQYNLALGEKRARAARDYLVNLGIDMARIDIVSYGKERPFAMGHNEEAWAQNRRAHFVQRGAR